MEVGGRGCLGYCLLTCLPATTCCCATACLPASRLLPAAVLLPAYLPPGYYLLLCYCW